MKYLYVIAFILMFASCEIDHTPVPDAIERGNLSFNISYKVDDKDLSFSKLIYENEAGNKFSVLTIHYILSGFTFYNSNGEKVFSDAVLYVDAHQQKTNNFILKNIPVGDYTGLSFIIGLDSIHNVHDSLPATTDFQNMLWPDIMGGGYHFLKLEGLYKDGSSSIGYTMHLGQNGFAPVNFINKSFSLTEPKRELKLNLVMNVNEWFKNPVVYDFTIDGNSSMGDVIMMEKLALNGQDVFTLK